MAPLYHIIYDLGRAEELLRISSLVLIRIVLTSLLREDTARRATLGNVISFFSAALLSHRNFYLFILIFKP